MLCNNLNQHVPMIASAPMMYGKYLIRSSGISAPVIVFDPLVFGHSLSASFVTRLEMAISIKNKSRVPMCPPSPADAAHTPIAWS